MLNSKGGEAGEPAAGAGEVGHEAAADRVGHQQEDDRQRARSPAAARPSPAWSGPRSGRGQARRVRSPGACSRLASGHPAVVEAKIAPVQTSRVSRSPASNAWARTLRFGIGLRQCHQHADPARAVLPAARGRDRPAAAPPSIVMKSGRFIRSPRRRGPAALGERRCRARLRGL